MRFGAPEIVVASRGLKIEGSRSFLLMLTYFLPQAMKRKLANVGQKIAVDSWALDLKRRLHSP